MSIIEQFAEAVMELTEALRETAEDPGDQIRLLCKLAQFGDTVPSSAFGTNTTDAVKSATRALCRRSALVSLARATSLYAPASSDEAKATLLTIMPLYDAEIAIAGDEGDNEVYLELRNLRTLVAEDLLARAINLPAVVEVQRNLLQPALTVAHSLYADAERADELVQRVSPVHPAFMPMSFKALSS